MGYHGRFEKPRKKRGGKIALIVVLVLLMLALGIAAAVWMYIDSKLEKLDIVEVPKVVYTEEATEPTAAPQTTATTTEATTEATTTETTEPPHVASSEDFINILLVGQASRAGEEARYADTMMLLTINKYEKTLRLTSFLRDAFAKMPDYKGHTGGRIKLTTIYHLGSHYSGGDPAGSMELMNMALYNNFGVEVDHNIEIDFDGVIKAIDLMGGVGIELTQEEADYLNDPSLDGWKPYRVEPGYFWLDGAGALCYARMRKAEGDGESDIARTSRQRNLINALLGRVMSMSISDINKLADEVLPMVTTSMSKQEIKDMLKLMLSILPELKMEPGGTCPVDGTYKGDEVDIYSDGTYHSVLRFNADQQKRLMRAITEGEIAE
ncbi:MAG: LCP family protein [Oscillospiraceae bacterium]|nr:LCP family protein [Oscillospiraceae bacterium]